MASKKFNVQCTSIDVYTINFDETRYPNLIQRIRTEFDNDPFQAAEELDICVDLDSSDYPDTDVSTLKWEKDNEL